MIEIVSFLYKDKELLAKAHEIRTKVFVEEQNVDANLELDDYDKIAQHYLAFIDSYPVATSRWRITDKGIKLERFAVLKEFRNNKIGEKLLTRVLSDVLPYKMEIYLHSQANALNIYLRNGFNIEGNEFEEAGIKHYKMYYSRS